MLPDCRELALIDVLPVDEDAPGMRSVEAEEETEKGGFATTGGTDDCGFGAGGNGEGERAEDRSSGIVVESDVLEGDGAACESKWFSGRRILCARDG